MYLRIRSSNSDQTLVRVNFMKPLLFKEIFFAEQLSRLLLGFVKVHQKLCKSIFSRNVFLFIEKNSARHSREIIWLKFVSNASGNARFSGKHLGQDPKNFWPKNWSPSQLPTIQLQTKFIKRTAVWLWIEDALMRFDSMRFDSMRFDSMRFDSMRFWNFWVKRFEWIAIHWMAKLVWGSHSELSSLANCFRISERWALLPCSHLPPPSEFQCKLF